jgi:hypothetical protein
MAQCEVCSNKYDKGLEVMLPGRDIRLTALSARSGDGPACEHCGCNVIGYGIEVSGRFFCCAHCAKAATSAHVKDRAA